MMFDQDIINRNQPAVLVFGAEWSGNAEIMHGIVERVSQEHGDKTNFYRIDVEKTPNIANFFGISTVPTVVLIKRGEIVNKVEGLLSASKLRKYIKQIYTEKSDHIF